MQALGLIIGLIGLPLLVLMPPIGVLAILVGLLMVVAGSNTEKRQTEERRHLEVVNTIRQGQGLDPLATSNKVVLTPREREAEIQRQREEFNKRNNQTS
jgi:hypothetical protein